MKALALVPALQAPPSAGLTKHPRCKVLWCADATHPGAARVGEIMSNAGHAMANPAQALRMGSESWGFRC